MSSLLLPNNTCEHLNPKKWIIVAVFRHMFTANGENYFKQYRNLIENIITECHVQDKTDKHGFITWVKKTIKHERSADEQAELALECMRELTRFPLNDGYNTQSKVDRKRYTLDLNVLSDVIELLLEYIFYKPLENRWIDGDDYENISYEDVLHNICETFISTDKICPGLYTLIKKLEMKNPFKWYYEIETKRNQYRKNTNILDNLKL